MYYYNIEKKKKQVEILKDLDGRGKKRDWDGKKKAGLKLSRVYSDIAKQVKPEYEQRGVHTRYDKKTGAKPIGLYDTCGQRVVNYEKRAANMKYCGSHLDFVEVDEKLKLVKANFCRVPLCPMCQWQKSMRIYRDVSRIMKIIEVRPAYVTYVPVFLTLTVKNCSVADLSGTLDMMFKGWDSMMRSDALNPAREPIVKGWFRALEVEYKHKTDEFHPHFHAVMLVERSYFTGKNYKSTADWVQLWRRFAKLDYDPICDIRKTRTSKDKRNEVAEVAKYTYKDSEILNNILTDEKKIEVVKALSTAFHGRRLYAYGGCMKTIAAELKAKDAADKAEAEADEADESEINDGPAKTILSYRWDMSLSLYLRYEKNEKKEKGFSRKKDERENINLRQIKIE